MAKAYRKPGTHLDEREIGPDTAAVVIQQPDYLGRIVDARPIIEQAHAAGALAIMIVNPIAQALLKTPAELGADYVVGDGQPLGCGMNYGGPALGFIATGKKNLRRLPGRIVAFRRTPMAVARSCLRCRRANSTSGAIRLPPTFAPTRRSTLSR